MRIDRPQEFAAPEGMAPADAGFEARVVALHDATPEIRVFELQRADGAPLAPCTAGAHIDLHLAPGLVRQYSLCNGPAQRDRYVIAVKREPASRGGSAALHERVAAGDLLKVTGPRNHFPLAKAAAEHLLLAAGIGVTPLLAMARQLKADCRRFRLVYFTRSPEHTAFREELAGADWAGCVDFQHGLEPAQLPAVLRRLLADPRPGGHVYVCGPRPFMEQALALAGERYPAGTVHSEFFSGDAALQAAPTRGFAVRCARSGKQLQVAEGESIVAVLGRHGVHVETMCQQGVCGTCLTGVLQGRPDHRDCYLTDEERATGNAMLVCCSRSLDPLLVLDL